MKPDLPQGRRVPKRRCGGFSTPCDDGLIPYVGAAHVRACQKAGRHRCRSREILRDEVWCMDCYVLTK